MNVVATQQPLAKPGFFPSIYDERTFAYNSITHVIWMLLVIAMSLLGYVLYDINSGGAVNVAFDTILIHGVYGCLGIALVFFLCSAVLPGPYRSAFLYQYRRKLKEP